MPGGTRCREAAAVKSIMLIQALSLVSALLFLVGVILATNFTVAKNLANQKMAFALQIASGRALNDAQSWARDTLALNDSESQPVVLRVGSGSESFGCVDTGCGWQFINQWRVTGGMADQTQTGQQSTALNLEPALQEGRASITITTTLYKTLSGPLHSAASRSSTITGRYLNTLPYFAVTAVRDVSANVAAIDDSEGDSGGVRLLDEKSQQASSPDASVPGAYTKTALNSQMTCVNSKDAQHANDPKLDVPSAADMPTIPHHAYVPNEETLVWIYEAPCVTPSETIFDAPPNSDVNSQGEYRHSGSANKNWKKGDSEDSTFAN